MTFLKGVTIMSTVKLFTHNKAAINKTLSCMNEALETDYHSAVAVIS